MEVFLIKALQFLLSLSILVVLHELGHFLPAKFFGARVEKFYMFFDWKFSLFKYKKGETEYGIGWIPLGGYVKISGMIDESMDTDQMKSEAQPWEFRSKPAWQRLIILMGGVTVNVLLAMIIYAGVLFTWGEKYLPSENLVDGVWVADSTAYEMGFRNGDKILDIGGRKIERFSDIMPEMLYGGAVTVQRASGQTESIKIPSNFIETLIDENKKLLFLYRAPFVVKSVPEESQNAGIDLQQNDIVVGINNERIKYFDEFADVAKNYKNQEVELLVKRGDRELTIDAQVDDKGKIGVVWALTSLKDLEKLGYYQLETREYGLLESIPAGIVKGVNQLGDYLRQLKLIFNPETGAYKGVGGFAAIGNLFPAEWNWQVFWNLTAFLSIMLAVVNLLPIPALDGGHVMFTLWEMITGRKPSDKFMEYAQMVGIVLLLSLFVFANGNDLFKMLK
jgi:regulator of sigma E protease